MGGVVFGALFNERQVFAVERDHHALLPVLARRRANVAVKVDRAHDAIPALFVDDTLDGQPVVRDGLVHAVHVRLLDNVRVKRAQGIVLHHSPEIVLTDLGDRLLELDRRVRRKPGLAQQELRGVGIGHSQLLGQLVVRQSRRGFGGQHPLHAAGQLERGWGSFNYYGEAVIPAGQGRPAQTQKDEQRCVAQEVSPKHRKLRNESLSSPLLRQS